jgi:hypothetical protein
MKYEPQIKIGYLALFGGHIVGSIHALPTRPWPDSFYGNDAKAYGKWSHLEQDFDNIVVLKGGKEFPKELIRKCTLVRAALVVKYIADSTIVYLRMPEHERLSKSRAGWTLCNRSLFSRRTASHRDSSYRMRYLQAKSRNHSLRYDRFCSNRFSEH